MELFVGTFNVPYVYTLTFNPQLAHLNVTHVNNATAAHPWLSFAPNQTTLYATAWDPATVTAYRNQLDEAGALHTLEVLNTKPVVRSPGYVTASQSYVYSVGGASGEVFHVESDGSLGDLAQLLDFPSGNNSSGPAPGGVAGLRTGSHSADLSPDGGTLYVADIGANGVWTFADSASDSCSAVLADQKLHTAPRDDDGPRHAWPHPNGKILYAIGEHSSMVDVFLVKRLRNGTVSALEHVQSASALPQGGDRANYEGATVRLSTGPPGESPRYLFAATRGHTADVNGYVSAFELDGQGKLVRTEATDIWETPTSGANAIQPAPWVAAASPDAAFLQYVALTDPEVGAVRILGFDGARIQDLGAVTLQVPASDRELYNGTVEVATPLWLQPFGETA